MGGRRAVERWRPAPLAACVAGATPDWRRVFAV